jgi:hypothetical protein
LFAFILSLPVAFTAVFVLSMFSSRALLMFYWSVLTFPTATDIILLNLTSSVENGCYGDESSAAGSNQEAQSQVSVISRTGSARDRRVGERRTEETEKTENESEEPYSETESAATHPIDVLSFPT